MKSHKKCISCGLEDNKVEAGGIWHCPNPRCTVSGAAWFRSKLKSFKEIGNRHTVDENEWQFAADLYERSPEIFKEIYDRKTT